MAITETQVLDALNKGHGTHHEPVSATYIAEGLCPEGSGLKEFIETAEEVHTILYALELKKEVKRRTIRTSRTSFDYLKEAGYEPIKKE